MLPDDASSLRLRRPDACALCGVALPKGAEARWSPSVRLVYCEACSGGAALAIKSAGTAGSGAAEIHKRRQAADQTQLRARWGPVAHLVDLIRGPKQSTDAWAKGAEGEARLGAFLERELTGEAIVLHDRRIPGHKANIDHIAIGPSGIWVIDAKNHTGRVEQRDVGGPFHSDLRVFVGDRDQTRLVNKLEPQVRAVQVVLRDVPAFAELPVHPSLCFTNSDWGLLNLGKPFVIDDVLITYPGGLRDAIRDQGTLTKATISLVAARLATSLA